MVKRFFNRDRKVIHLIMILMTLFLSLYLYIDYTEQKSSLQTQITRVGRVTLFGNSLQAKNLKMTDWHNLHNGDEIHYGHLLKTNNNSSSIINLKDRPYLIQRKNTEIILDTKFDLISKTSDFVRLLRGEILISTMGNKKLRKIRFKGGVLYPDENFRTIVGIESTPGLLKVEVYQGRALLRLESGIDYDLNELEQFSRLLGASGVLAIIPQKRIQAIKRDIDLFTVKTTN